MNIQCLFSIDNEYDQPVNNLVAWWPELPDFETVLSAIGGSLANQNSIIAAANILQGREARFDNTDYRLSTVPEGVCGAEA